MSNLALSKKKLADNVLAKVNQFQETNELHLPDNYSPENAIKNAWMYLQEAKNKDNKPVLESCTEESIANSLFNMVIEGLSVAKKQCYFIAYGNKLSYQRGYGGNIALAKRMSGVKTVTGNVIYEGDVDNFKYQINTDTGVTEIISHKPSFNNIDNSKIAGAYAIIVFEDGRKKTEIMKMEEIRKSWMQGATKGQSPAHKNFPDQMAIRTVINRALKIELMASDDGYLNDISRADKPEEIEEEVIDINAEVIEETQEEIKETTSEQQEEIDF